MAGDDSDLNWITCVLHMRRSILHRPMFIQISTRIQEFLIFLHVYIEGINIFVLWWILPLGLLATVTIILFSSFFFVSISLLLLILLLLLYLSLSRYRLLLDWVKNPLGRVLYRSSKPGQIKYCRKCMLRPENAAVFCKLLLSHLVFMARSFRSLSTEVAHPLRIPAIQQWLR